MQYRIIIRSAVAAAAFVACSTPAHAQLAETCGWHFLDAVESPATIQQLKVRLEPAAQFAEEVDRVQAWYRRCDHTASRTAVQRLRRMERRNWAEGAAVKALIGTALMRGPDVQVEHAEGAWLRPMHQISNAERDGARLLAEVAEQTGWPEVIQELALVTAATRRKQTLGIADEGLDKVPEAARDAAYWAARAELSYAQKDYAAAREAAATAMEMGSVRGTRMLGVTMMLLDDTPDEGAAVYLRGLAESEGRPEIHWYYDDLRLLLGPDEMEQWTSLESGHAAWIRARWDWRTMIAGIEMPARLREHHQRLVHILDTYPRQSYRGSTPPTSVWTHSPLVWLQPVDDRGIIYLRHGEPREVLMIPRPRSIPRIAWHYAGAGPMKALFEFDKAERADYFLAEPYPVCGGRDVVSGGRPSASLPNGFDMLQWSEMLNRLDPELSAYYRQCRFNSSLATTSFMHARDEARRAANEAWNSETAVPRLADPFQSLVNLYTFRSAAGSELNAYASVMAGRLNADATSAPMTYALDMLLATGNPVTGAVLRADTALMIVRQEPLPEGAVIGTAMNMIVTPAERTAVTLTIMNRFDSEQGQVLATTKAIPDFSTSALMLSDLVIAEPRDGVFRRGSYNLAPAPGHIVAAGRTFRLFHELYGVNADDPLTISVVIAPSTDPTFLERLRSLIEQRTALSVEFSETAEADTDGVIRMQRDITADLEPGGYRVVVTIRNARTGESANAETNIVVHQP